MNYETMKAKINHLQHVGIPVTSLSNSIAFYQKFGFTNIMDKTFEHDAGKGNVAMMKLGEIIIELYQMPPAVLAEIRGRKNGHIDHIAFDVDDIEAMFEELKNLHFNIIEDAPVTLPFWKKGCRYFNIAGPDGERLEFNQILR
jgi:catechol 2,3-dioxygenase-like lactoylglutathione lyase family enzyme